MRNGQRARLGRRAQDARTATEYRPGTDTAAPKTLSGLAVTPPYPSIQRYASGGDELGGTEADAGIAGTLQRRKGAGRPLDRVNADRFSSGFGADLSSVRLHTDGEADRIARSVQSVAFTYGRDVYFSRGSYQPGTESGDHLLAHELAHVVQGSSGRWAAGGSGVQIGRADDPAEAAADVAADQVMAQLRSGVAPDPAAVGSLPAAQGEPIARTVRRAGLKSLAKKVKKAFTGKKKKSGPKGRPVQSRTLGGATVSQLRALSDAQQGHTGTSSQPKPKKPVVMDDMDFDDAKSELDDDFEFNSSAEDDGHDDFDEGKDGSGGYLSFDPNKVVDDDSELSSSEDDEAKHEPVGYSTPDLGGKPKTDYGRWDPNKVVDDDDFSEVSSDEDDEEPVVIPVRSEEKKDKPKANYGTWDPNKVVDDDDFSEVSSDEDDEEPVVIPVKSEEKKDKPKANYGTWDPNQVVEDDDDLSISEDEDEPTVFLPLKSEEKKDKPKANYRNHDPNKPIEIDLDDDDDLSISEDEDEPEVVIPPRTQAKTEKKSGARVKKGKHSAFLTRGVAAPYKDEAKVANDEPRQVMQSVADIIRRATGVIADIQAGMTPKQALARTRLSREIEDELKALGDDAGKWTARLDEFIKDRIEFCKRQEIPLDQNNQVGDISGRLVHYDSEEDQAKSLVTVKNGLLCRADGEVVDTSKSSTFFSGNGVEIFVASEGGELHMASHKIGKYHHSSLLAGSDVAIGGEMKVTGGKIEWMSNKSGHYTPSKDHLVQFLHWLSKDGIDLKTVAIRAGFGVPGGKTAEQLVAGMDDTGLEDDKEGFYAIKLRAVMKAYEDHFGFADDLDDFLDKNHWLWYGGRMRDDRTDRAIDPKTVITVLKAKFGVPSSVGAL